MCRLPFHKMIRRCVIFCVLFVCSSFVRKVRDIRTFSGKLVCPARIVCVRCEGECVQFYEVPVIACCLRSSCRGMRVLTE